MAGPFEGILGGNCELKILEFLLPLENMDFNITELAEEADVSRPTANRVVKKFIEWGIMIIAQRRGGNDYYQINPESPFVIAIENFNNTIIEHMLGEETLYEIHDYWIGRTPQIKVEVTSIQAKPAINAKMYEEDGCGIDWPGITTTGPLLASPAIGLGAD